MVRGVAAIARPTGPVPAQGRTRYHARALVPEKSEPLFERELEEPPLAGRFQLGDVLGQGGMSLVRRAVDLDTGHDVAVKMLLTPYGSTERELGRFEREIEILSDLAHPGIVRLFAHGVATDGRIFVAMELVEGGSLARRLRERGPLDLEETLAIVSCIAGALGAAHQQGILHRDIKPANVILTGNPATPAKLIDFGLARAPRPDRMTRDGQPLGTPGYMSPEQFLADSQYDHRSDEYALAVLAYCALAGRPPYSTMLPLADITDAMLGGLAPPLDQVRPSIPRAVAAVIAKAMSVDPERRYAGCAEFAEALHATARAQPSRTKSRRPPSPARARWGVRAAIGGAGLLVGLGVGLAVAPVVLECIEEAPSRPAEHREPRPPSAIGSSPDGGVPSVDTD